MCKKLIFLFAFLVVLVSTSTLSAYVEENILINGSFEDGFQSPWVFDNGTPAYEIVSDAQDGLNALKVTIAEAGSSEYIPALAQPGISFEAGKYYTFSVFLKGSYDGMQVYLKPQQRGGSYTGYGAAYVTLTTEWAEYSVTTPVFSSTVATADVSIWLGMQAGDVYIDHVRFYEGDYTEPGPTRKATNPIPPSGTSDLTRFNMLSWEPGLYADSHNLYFGTDEDAVTNATVENPMDVLVSQQQTDAFYDTAGDYGTTYYWRIDEVNEADMKITKGHIWNFSTKPIGLTIPQSSITVTASSQKDADQGPEKTIDGSGLNAQNQHGTTNTTMWLSDVTNEPNKAWIRYDFDKLYKMPRMLIWNSNLSGFTSGYAIMGVLIEYSSDGGTTWKTLADVNELQKGTGTADYEPMIVDLGGVADGLAINALKITALSNWSSNFKQYGLSEVKFYYVPVWPTNPNPADTATGVDIYPTLSWTAGDGAVEHKVYFGTNEQAVTNGSASSYVVADSNYITPELLLGQTYFWRVVEVNNASTPSEWSGDTWSFTVIPYTVVDDFEGYSTSIDKWSGGSSASGNGAALSLDTTIANNGSKSMKFMFDDTSDGGISEVSAEPKNLLSGKNWTKGSPKWLVFWVYGDLSNITTEKLYVRINEATYWYFTQTLISADDLVTPWWTQVKVPLINTQVTLNDVDWLKIGFTKTKPETGSGQIHIDDIRLYRDAPAPLLPVNPGDANLVARYKLDGNVNDSSSNHLNGTVYGDPNYVVGPFGNYGMAKEFKNSSYVDLGKSEPNEGFNPKGSFSVSYWANIHSWTSSWGCAMVANRGESGIGWQIRRGSGYGTNGNSLVFTTRGISNDDMYSNKTPPLNQWVHITCVYDSVAFTKAIYFDDKLIIKTDLTGDVRKIAPTTHNTYLGGRANGGNTGVEAFFTGDLDEVRIYNKALSDGEIRYLFNPTP